MKRAGWVVTLMVLAAGLLWWIVDVSDVPPPQTPPLQSPGTAADAGTVPGAPRTAAHVDRVPPDKAPAPTDAKLAAPSPGVLGRVVDDHGRPVARADVVVMAAEAADPASRRVTRATSGEDGRFDVALSRSGTFVLAAYRDEVGYARPAPFEVGPARIELGDVRLFATSLLEGRLVYPDGEPIAGLRVSLERDDPAPPAPGASSAWLDTDEDGRFRLRSLAPGTYRADLPVLRNERDEAPPPRFVTGGSEQTVVIDLHRIRADVAGLDRKPLAGAWLGLDAFDEALGPQLAEVLAGRGDWMALRSQARRRVSAVASLDRLVPRGSWWWLHASGNDHLAAETLLEADRTRNETALTLQLRPPERTATLRLRLHSTDGHSPSTLWLDAESWTFGVPTVHRAEVAGRDGDDFLFRLPAGRFALTVQADPGPRGQSPYPELVRQVEMRDGSETLVDAALERGGRVALIVRRTDAGEGARPLRYRVEIDRGSGQEPLEVREFQTNVSDEGYTQWRTGRTDERCVCRTLLSPGQHELTVIADGYAPQRVGVKIAPASVTDVEVWLQPQ